MEKQRRGFRKLFPAVGYSLGEKRKRKRRKKKRLSGWRSTDDSDPSRGKCIPHCKPVVGLCEPFSPRSQIQEPMAGGGQSTFLDLWNSTRTWVSRREESIGYQIDIWLISWVEFGELKSWRNEKHMHSSSIQKLHGFTWEKGLWTFVEL